MSLEMVHSNKGEPARERDGLASRHPYDQTADQARTRRGRDAADFTQAKPSFGERFGNETIEQLDMHARGGGLVAARFEAEDDKVVTVRGSSHDACLQGKTAPIEEAVWTAT